MRNRGRLLLFGATGLVVIVCLVGFLVRGGVELRVTRIRGGYPLLALPLRPGERFTLHYMHSVENAPIWEVHSVDREGRIYVEEERYLKFGAGMGKMPGVGRMVRRGPYEVIADMHQPIGDFVLRVGSPGVDHTVLWRGRRINLSARVPHEAVRFRARPIHAWHALWRCVRPHPATPPEHDPPGAGGEGTVRGDADTPPSGKE
ncbi:MAG: DUF1850 domain-containing protein [Desulfobacteraceae bacterium]